MLSDRVLVDTALWKEIRARAAKSKSLLVVVGYLGRHPRSVLRWPKRATVICDLSRETVARGASSARGARELHEKGVGIWSVRDLHAKIYIFDKSAIVGSANLSETSTRLVEAGVLVTNAAAVKRLRAYAKRLQADALPMNDAVVLGELVKLEPKWLAVKTVRRLNAAGKARLPFFDNDPVSLMTAMFDENETIDEAKAKAKRAKTLADEHGVQSDAIDWLSECGKGTKNALDEYHYVFFWWPTTSRASKAKYGWLDGPWQSIGGVDLGKKFGDRRYCVPHVMRRRRVIRLDRQAVNALAKVLGRKPAKDPTKLYDSINEQDLPVRLSPIATRRMSMFLRSRS